MARETFGMIARDYIAKCREHGPTPDSIEGLIALAWEMGAESAARRICDQHNELALGALARAEASRYHLMAAEIIGDLGKQIYSDHYAGDCGDMFGGDELPEKLRKSLWRAPCGERV